jgi:hypothetical protein
MLKIPNTGLRRWHIMVMQVLFKFPHSVSATSFGVRGLIRLGTSCMEDVSLVAAQ